MSAAGSLIPTFYRICKYKHLVPNQCSRNGGCFLYTQIQDQESLGVIDRLFFSDILQNKQVCTFSDKFTKPIQFWLLSCITYKQLKKERS